MAGNKPTIEVGLNITTKGLGAQLRGVKKIIQKGVEGVTVGSDIPTSRILSAVAKEVRKIRDRVSLGSAGLSEEKLKQARRVFKDKKKDYREDRTYKKRDKEAKRQLGTEKHLLAVKTKNLKTDEHELKVLVLKRKVQEHVLKERKLTRAVYEFENPQTPSKRFSLLGAGSSVLNIAKGGAIGYLAAETVKTVSALLTKQTKYLNYDVLGRSLGINGQGFRYLSGNEAGGASILGALQSHRLAYSNNGINSLRARVEAFSKTTRLTQGSDSSLFAHLIGETGTARVFGIIKALRTLKKEGRSDQYIANIASSAYGYSPDVLKLVESSKSVSAVANVLRGRKGFLSTSQEGKVIGSRITTANVDLRAQKVVNIVSSGGTSILNGNNSLLSNSGSIPYVNNLFSLPVLKQAFKEFGNYVHNFGKHVKNHSNANNVSGDYGYFPIYRVHGHPPVGNKVNSSNS